MKPIPGLDPPEYVAWREDPAILDEFARTVERRSRRWERVSGLSRATRLRLYEGLVRNRLHDLQLKRWVRSGVLSKAWLGPGEEAVTVGACHALGPDDAVGPMIRNAGALHERGVPLAEMFRGTLGTADGPTRGRDIHFGDLRHGVVGPISMVGSLVPVCAGMALAYRLRGETRVALTWVGDGTVGTAGFHEGMTSAVAVGAPLVVVVQNNRIALGTVLPEDGEARLEALGAAYGVRSLVADGNQVLDVFAAVREARESALQESRPVIVVAHTFRMGGHATHDEGISRELLPADRFEYFGRRDPVRVYRAFLRRGGAGGPPIPEPDLVAIETRLEAEAREAEAEAIASHQAQRPDPATARAGVFDD